MVTKIQLNTKGYLDVIDTVPVPLNFSVAEIQDISKRQGGYSKSIDLPGTSNNHRIFAHLFDVNVQDSISFNINVKEPCSILQNGIPVFSGFLQLLNVTKRSPSLANGDEQIIYTVQVRDDSGDFYSSMDDKLLEDLDFGTQYNHKLTPANIFATSANTWSDVYKYHLGYNLNSKYYTEDFTAGIFAKAYFDKIITDAGFSYQWDSLTGVLFDKVIIPYNGDTPSPDMSIYSFKAFTTADTYEYDVTTGDYLIFDQEEFDEEDVYNPSTGIYTSNFQGTNTYKTHITYSVWIDCDVNTQYNNQINHGYQGEHTFRLEMNMGNIPITNRYFWSKAIQEGESYSAGMTMLSQGILTADFTAIAPVLPLDSMVNEVLYSPITTGGFWSDQIGNPIPSPRIILKLHTDDEREYSNTFRNIPTPKYGLNFDIELNNLIPKKIKQKDFIASVVKAYNLYITPDREVDKKLIIETRDEFYDNGQTLDWTNKIDLQSEVKVEFLSDIQNKKLLLTYKQDSDVWNKTYQQATNEIYGQAEYTFESEFVKDTKKIELIFSPTPMNENGQGNIVPMIDTTKPKNNIRFIYDGGWISGNTWIFASTTGVSQQTWTFNTYPYAGHLYPHPKRPVQDLNFGLVDYMYYDSWSYLTNNNLYNQYWSRTISQIENGKLMTATFFLNEYDLSNLDFRNKIFIQDCYWYLNRVVDYDTNGNGLTKCELISVEDGVRFEPFSSTTYSTKTGTLFNGTPVDGPTNPTNTFGGNNAEVDVKGDRNRIQYGTKNTVVVGDGNDVGSTGSLIIGDNNTIQGDNIFAFGVDNTTLRQSNSMTFGGTILYKVDAIDAGRDRVLNPFNTVKTVNFICAGRDAVIHLGSMSVENHISAGRDSVI